MRSRKAAGVAAAVVMAAALSGVARAQPAVEATGVLDYEARPPGDTVESIVANVATLTFPVGGGAFRGDVQLQLGHDVPARGCRFESNHVWTITGDFDPEALRFAGTYEEVVEATTGACENFTFSRTFDPDMGPFTAFLDPATGVLTSSSAPVDIRLQADPAALTDLLPPPPPPPTVLDGILDGIRDRQATITATGEAAVAATGDVELQSSEFTVRFNPLGGPAEVEGEVVLRGLIDLGEVECVRVLRDGVEGAATYGTSAGTMTGTFRSQLTQELEDCPVEAAFEAIQPRLGEFLFTVDESRGALTGNIAGYDLRTTFDPAALPPEPDAQFRIESIGYAFGEDLLRIAIEWGEAWPPEPPVSGDLVVGGELTTPDGPIVFGIRLDDGVPGTFMDPPGGYAAFTDDRGRAIIDLRAPDIDALAAGGGLRVLAWSSVLGGGPGTRLSEAGTPLDPAAADAVLLAAEPSVELPAYLATLGADAIEPPEPPAGEEEPEAPPPTEARELTDPVEAAPDPGGSGGFSWIIPVAVLGSVALPILGGLWWLRRQRPAPAPPGEARPDGDCEARRRAWEAAQRDCDSAGERADRLGRDLGTASENQRRLESERAGQPSEETRVELPDGTSLSQLDLELRRAAAGSAWDDYMANPSPESAAEAVAAWNRQATPEWLAEQRRRHRQRREDLDRRVAEARAEKDRIGEDLADARTAQRDSCARATEAKRAYDECVRRAAAVAAAAPTPPPAPAPAPPAPPPADEPAPAGAPAPAPGGGPAPTGDERCRDGDERWVEVDGPHPFTVGVDDRVHVMVTVISGTRRMDRLGSLDRQDWTAHDARGRAEAIPFGALADLQIDDLREAFRGPGGLKEVWDTAGAGAVQQLTINLRYQVRHTMLACERKLVCVDGVWVETRERRVRRRGEDRLEWAEAGGTVLGNIEPGRGRAEQDYVAEAAGLLAPLRGPVGRLIEAKRTMDGYVDACRSGARG